MTHSKLCLSITPRNIAIIVGTLSWSPTWFIPVCRFIVLCSILHIVHAVVEVLCAIKRLQLDILHLCIFPSAILRNSGSYIQHDQRDLSDGGEDYEGEKSLVLLADHNSIVITPVDLGTRVGQCAIDTPGEQTQTDQPEEKKRDVDEHVEQRRQSTTAMNERGYE